MAILSDGIGCAVLGDRREQQRAIRELRRQELSFHLLGLDERRRDRLVRAVGRALGRNWRAAPTLRAHPAKAWDALQAVSALRTALPRDAPLLDMGCVASPVIPALARLGYRDLHGIDLDKRVLLMPPGGADFRVGDMFETPWPENAFAAVTAISVIEHGFDAGRLLREVTRLLRPGGLFIFSTDFWPEKIDTTDVSAFGLDWTIFSAGEIRDLLDTASAYGLRAAGGCDLARVLAEPLSSSRPPVTWLDRSYTFFYATLVFDPTTSESASTKPVPIRSHE